MRCIGGSLDVSIFLSLPFDSSAHSFVQKQ